MKLGMKLEKDNFEMKTDFEKYFKIHLEIWKWFQRGGKCWCNSILNDECIKRNLKLGFEKHISFFKWIEIRLKI